MEHLIQLIICNMPVFFFLCVFVSVALYTQIVESRYERYVDLFFFFQISEHILVIMTQESYQKYIVLFQK